MLGVFRFEDMCEVLVVYLAVSKEEVCLCCARGVVFARQAWRYLLDCTFSSCSFEHNELGAVRSMLGQVIRFQC